MAHSSQLLMGAASQAAFATLPPPRPRAPRSRRDAATPSDAAAFLKRHRGGESVLGDLLGPLYNRDTAPPPAPTAAARAGRPPAPMSAEADALPLADPANAALVACVHPADYVNPPAGHFDLVVVGAGVAGLLSVICAKALGKKAALVELLQP